MKLARILPVLVLSISGAACASAPMAAPPLQLEALPLAAIDGLQAPSAALPTNHFVGDLTRRIDEKNLKKVLDAPVYIEAHARVGIIGVVGKYEVDGGLPLVGVPDVIGRQLDDASVFDVVTEVSSDWPIDRGLSGLRELAARYRSEYLLLYRHRFVSDWHTNAWGAAYMTLLGSLFVPSRTLKASGVVEATLFDVRSGTILFTVFERVYGESEENVWQNDRKLARLERSLLNSASTTIAERVVDKVRELDSARLRYEQAPTERPIARTGPIEDAS